MNESAIIETFVTLISAVAVLGIILFIVKKYGAKAQNNQNDVELKLLAKMPLPPKNNVYVIKAGGKTLLIGSSEKNIATLAELDQDTPKSKLDKISPELMSTNDELTFSSFLKSTLKKSN